MTDVKCTANSRNTIDAEDRRQRAGDSRLTPILDARETGNSNAIADVSTPIPSLPVQLPKIDGEINLINRCSGLFRLSMQPASAPGFEALLRIDPKSGKKPVPRIKKNGVSLGEYTMCYKIVDTEGHVIGFSINEDIPERDRIDAKIYNQSGELIAQRKGRHILRKGQIIGYIRGKGIYDTHGTFVYAISDVSSSYGRIVINKGKITALIMEKKSPPFEGLFSASRLIQLVRRNDVALEKRLNALDKLTMMRTKEIKIFEKELKNYPPKLRGKLLVSLCKAFPTRRMHFARIAMNDADENVHLDFVRSLRENPWIETIDQSESIALRTFEESVSPAVRREAALVIEDIGLHKTHAYFEKLLAMLEAAQKEPGPIRDDIILKYSGLIQHLGHIPGQKSIDLLRAFLKFPDKRIQKECVKAIKHLAHRSPSQAFPLALSYFYNNRSQTKLSKDGVSLLYLVATIRFKNNKKCYDTYAPELRSLLSHASPEIRRFAICILAIINAFSLTDFSEVHQIYADAFLLNLVGKEIARTNNLRRARAVISQIRALGSKDSRQFSTGTHILVGILDSWRAKTPLLKEVISLYEEVLKRNDFSLRAKRMAIFLLIKIAKPIDVDSGMRDRIARSLLAVRGHLEIFALRNLAVIKDDLVGKIDAGLIATITDRLNDKLIRKSPPYDEWFNLKKNPDKIITAKMYFQMEQKDWEAFMKEDRFERKSQSGRTTIYEKKVNGVTLRTLLVDLSGEKGKIRTDIFKDMADPKIHYLGYSGHAGMGGNLEMNKKPTMKDPSAYGTKIIHVGACNSIRSYYARAMKMAPGSHFIGIVNMSYTDDEVKAFLATMNGIAYRKSWKQIGDDIKAKGPFVYHYQDKKPRSFFAHVLPHDLRQFKYAILNPLDRGGIESLSFAAPREDIREINATYGGRLRQAVHNLNDMLGYHRTFFGNAEMVTGNEIYDGIFFTNTTDDQTPLKITKVRNGTRPTYRVEVNAGFAHISESALSVLLMYEVNAHFSKEKHGSLTKEDKLRGLLMAAERIYYSYRGRLAAAEEIFGLLKQRHSIPQRITFREVYALQKAIDDTKSEVPALRKALLAKIN